MAAVAEAARIAAAVEGEADEAAGAEDEAFADEAEETGGAEGADEFVGDWRGNAIALGIDVAGTAAAFAARALRLPKVPRELSAILTAVDHLPPLRRALHRVAGERGADLGLSLAAAALAAAAQSRTAHLADAILRVILLLETAAERQAWARRAAEGHSPRPPAPDPPTPGSPGEPDDPPNGPGAPGAHGEGPEGAHGEGPEGAIERYARRMSTVTLLAAGAAAMLPSGARRAARLLMAGAPRTATIGREAYAGRLGALLAQRGVLVREPAVLRLLDRIDTVVIDAGALHAEPATSGRRHGNGGNRTNATIGANGGGPRPEPLAVAVAEAARGAGRLLVAGGDDELAKRLRAEGTVPGGAPLAAAVRRLRREGRVVLVIADRNDAALRAADFGFGILRQRRRAPDGASLLGGPGLETAWLLLEAAALARQVSARGVKTALLGAATGGLLGVADPGPAGVHRAILATKVARVANLASAVWSVRGLGRRTTPAGDAGVDWHALPPEEVLHTLGTEATGLTDAEARRRIPAAAAHEEPEPGLLATTVAELDTPLTIPLAGGAGLSAVTGSGGDAVLVLSVILANALLTSVQDLTAGRTLRGLVSAAGPRVRLRRAEGERTAAMDELVPGDVVLLEAGDAVPADCRLLEASGLETDEAAVTGESAPVAKRAGISRAAAVAERTNMVYAGTSVAAGSATAVVVATGAETEAGRGARTAVQEAPAGGVQERLSRLARASLPVAGGAAAALLGAGLLRGRLAESIGSSVALAVAAIPEGLPFIATAAELSASRRLSRRNILVRDPRSLEALGRVGVVCFDKTGTLTEGRIALRTVSDGRSRLPVGEVAAHHRRILAAALRASPPPGSAALTHPTDQAVVTGGQAAGVRADESMSGWQVVRELPFEPARGFHAVLGTARGRQVISVKGAPETTLPRCVSWRPDGRSRALSRADRDEIEAEVDRLARQGLRVLAVAERSASARRSLDSERVDGMELLGLLGLADPTRPSAAAAVERLREAGIKVVMLTGDHPSTAAAIAAELDLLDGGTVVTGPQLSGADPDTVDALVSKASVFARVSPGDKVAVVRALRRTGLAVAVTGDGANDAPAIRLADVGIALGEDATTAAREAADLIVLDGRIETIADGVVEGRAMWASVRESLALLLGGNLGETLFTVAGSVLSDTAPLNARQILFVNLMTDLLPAITVAARPPRRVTPEQAIREGPESSLGGALTRDVVRRAIATSTATAAAWVAGRLTGTQERASTVALASLVGTQLAQTALAAGRDPVVLASTGASAAALVGVVQTPGVSGLFGCRPLGPVAWGIVLGATALGTVLAALPLPTLPGEPDDHHPPDSPEAT
ncbi:HAD-IC family P-type ATPase [Dactylosporangium sp. CA-092794]|uniref:cation-translocating P-type ATPase n=1 Tax=Dactylosporangium sp. CA-092794 TaxID=3239929 RepID=UPI003D8C937C